MTTLNNYSIAIFLVREDVRAVTVSYEVDKDGKGFNLNTFKTLDPTLKVGDYVVVPTDSRHNMTVCRIEAIDFEIELTESRPIDWLIAGPISRENFLAIKAAEADAIEQIKAAERNRARKELASKLLEDNPGLNLLKDALSPGSGLLPSPDFPEPYTPPPAERFDSFEGS